MAAELEPPSPSSPSVTGFPIAVLRLAAADSSISNPIRLIAAVHFKLFLRLRWSPDPSSPAPLLPDADKDQIKSHLIPLILTSSPAARSQLADALAVVSAHDFPSHWPSLLPDPTAALASANTLLTAVAFVFSHFRSAFDIRRDLKYSLDNFAAPLLDLFLRTSALPPSAASFEFQRHCCKIL